LEKCAPVIWKNNAVEEKQDGKEELNGGSIRSPLFKCPVSFLHCNLTLLIKESEITFFLATNRSPDQ